MSGAFEQAWVLLKASMPPFVPRKVAQRIGSGDYRVAFRQPDTLHTTKFGTGEKLADTLVLNQLAELYPEAFVGEELHPLPAHESQLPAFATTGKDGGLLGYDQDYFDGKFDYGPGGRRKGKYNVMPLTYTQELGRPITSNEEMKTFLAQKLLQDKMRANYPVAGALGLGDVKPENWAVMPKGGLDLPELTSEGQVKLIDPMFDYPRTRPFYTGEFSREANRFRQDMPELREFAEPWYKGLNQYEDPALGQQMLDTLIQGEQQNLDKITQPLTP